MKLEGERWRTLVSTVRLGRDEYRVVRPAQPLKHAPMFDTQLGVQVFVDKAAALTMAMAWEFAMRSPRTLVYLPLRDTDCECGDPREGPLLDLVLLHHSLGFPASRWKELRARLGAGRPHTVQSRGFPELESLLTPDYQPFSRRFRDVVRHDFAADTLFLSGSRRAFAIEGEQWRALVEEGPRQMHENPGEHCCAEITVDRDWDWLHVVYCDEHRVHA